MEPPASKTAAPDAARLRRLEAYEAIRDYVRRNGSKVLLLTATPYNLAFADVANQIGLYIDDDEDLGIQPSQAMAKDPTLIDKVDGKITTLAAFRRSEEPEEFPGRDVEGDPVEGRQGAEALHDSLGGE